MVRLYLTLETLKVSQRILSSTKFFSREEDGGGVDDDTTSNWWRFRDAKIQARQQKLVCRGTGAEKIENESSSRLTFPVVI